MELKKGHVVAITGAASGIGRALALEVARLGCEVAIADVDDAGLEETRTAVEALGVRVTTAHLDVADRAAVHAWADRAVAEHGRVHVVVNNAGVALGARIEGMRYEDLEWVMNVDFWGVVHGTKAFLPHLRAAGEGHIVNVSSVFGLVGVPTQAAYNAAKFAVRGFTEALREELELEGGGVSCTCVHPGGIRTNIARDSRIGDLGPLARTGEQIAKDFERVARTSPEEAARAIVAGIRNDERRLLIGPDAYLIDAVQRLLPTWYQALLVRLMRWQA